MMSVVGASTGDIVLAPDGRVWRVMARWEQPVIQLKELDEPRRDRHGGENASMWDGWKVIHKAADAP